MKFRELGFTDIHVSLLKASAPPWFINTILVVVIIDIVFYVVHLSTHHWLWAIIDATCVLVNAGLAYFNTLPLYQRIQYLIPSSWISHEYFDRSEKLS